jgi:hypothetical protein
MKLRQLINRIDLNSNTISKLQYFDEKKKIWQDVEKVYARSFIGFDKGMSMEEEIKEANKMKDYEDRHDYCSNQICIRCGRSKGANRYFGWGSCP